MPRAPQNSVGSYRSWKLPRFRKSPPLPERKHSHLIGTPSPPTTLTWSHSPDRVCQLLSAPEPPAAGRHSPAYHAIPRHATERQCRSSWSSLKAFLCSGLMLSSPAPPAPLGLQTNPAEGCYGSSLPMSSPGGHSYSSSRRRGEGLQRAPETLNTAKARWQRRMRMIGGISRQASIPALPELEQPSVF